MHKVDVTATQRTISPIPTEGLFVIVTRILAERESRCQPTDYMPGRYTGSNQEKGEKSIRNANVFKEFRDCKSNVRLI